MIEVRTSFLQMVKCVEYGFGPVGGICIGKISPKRTQGLGSLFALDLEQCIESGE